MAELARSGTRGLVCFRRAVKAWKMSAFTFSSLSLNLERWTE